ncbi:hypothetical protein V8E51_008781 [Hyaloscypha variabilis]
MSSFESSKSFHGLGRSSRQNKVSRSRPKIQASPVGESVVKNLRHKRVLKACERCKIKKIKCDAGAPCKRCKEDGMICAMGSRRRPKFESVPRAYAELLENTNSALKATVEKLYIMLRNGETWELDEPELNENGMPIIHDVSKILGCIRGPQDNVRSGPGMYRDLYETESRTYLAHPEFGEDERTAHSEGHHSSSESGRLSSQSQNPEPPFVSTANSQIQQEDWSSPWEHPVPKPQGSQQKPEIILSDFLVQETQDYESDSPFFPIKPLDSPSYQFLTPETDIFNTREAANSFLLDIPQEIDWIIWRDLLPFENVYKVTEAVGHPNATDFEMYTSSTAI